MALQFGSSCQCDNESLFVKSLLLALALLTAGPSHSQTSIFTESICLPTLNAMREFAIAYDELPLFSGLGLSMIVSQNTSNPVYVPVFFTVNQETGTWSLFLGVTPDTACLWASGTNFTIE